MLCETGIYLITHVASGRPYVGLTGCKGGFAARWKQEIGDLTNNRASSPLLQEAWNEYGSEAFSFSVHAHILRGDMCRIEFYTLLRKEERRIQKLYPENLNSMKAGAGGMEHTKEAKEKMSISITKAFQNPETRMRLKQACQKAWSDPEKRNKIIAAVRKARLGKKHSTETKDKIKASQLRPEVQIKKSLNLQTKWQDPKFREKTIAARKGYKHSLETKKKIKEALNRPETILKLSLASKGKKKSLAHITKLKIAQQEPVLRALKSARMKTLWAETEWRNKMMATRKDYRHSEETKAKIRISLKASHNTPEYRLLASQLRMGQKHSLETKEKLKLAAKRRSNTPEGRAQMKERSKLAALQPNVGFRGRKHTEESKAKTSATLLANKNKKIYERTPEIRARISASLKEHNASIKQTGREENN